jgi:cell division protein FtsI (penicillin-binding protein 3)
VAEEHASSRFRLPWKLPVQRVARRESVQAPFEWRSTLRARVLVCAAALAVWTVGIEARLIYLQVIAHGEMAALAEDQQLMTVNSAPKRGDIVDRNGRLLAYSVDAETIGAHPTKIEDPEEAVRLLCDALGTCDASRRKALLATLRRDAKFVYVERQASPDAGRRVRALDLAGIVTYPENRRYYPNRTLAAHVLGYVGVDNDGLAGLESAYDTRIRGRSGRMLLQVDSRREALAVREAVLPTAGDSLELTIDQYLQRIAERELRAGVEEHHAAAGRAVIMHPQTGAILALANYPTFNPNKFKASALEDRKNRAIQDVYEPGSTFKLVTASAALEEGILDTTDMIDCAPGWIKFPGRKPITEAGGHNYGALSFEDVIVKSSNVGAIKAGQKIGIERLSMYVNRFGFGQVLSRDFRGQSRGIWNPSDLDESGLASVSMGYQISVTPLQMAAAVSSVANGGMLYEPRLIGAFVHNGRREPVEPKALRRTISAETAATMTSIMEAVVEHGTAKAARIDGFTIAGKTGTAAMVINGGYSKTEYHTSFIGFAPSRKPALTVIVVIDSPHGNVRAYGGTVAAPIFKRIVEASLRHLGIGPTVNAPSPVIVARADSAVKAVRPLPAGVAAIRAQVLEPARPGLMPDLRGLSVREALHSVTTIGLNPRVSGSGFVVEQSPEPGAVLIPGEPVSLTLGRWAPAIPAGGRPQ